MHPQQLRFKLSWQAAVLSIISAVYPMMSYGVTAGKADFVIGNVVIVAADGNRRVLSKGSEINTGDTINTSAGARAQLRFLDGGFVSLQPDTQFRVDEYNYQNKTDGSEKSFFSLLKGGFRAITGSIGHPNHNNYKVATPSATIGIRGTGYKAEIRDDGLLVSVGEGAILLTNNVGVLVVSSGGAAFVANMNTAPAPSTEQPHTPPANIQPLTNPSAIITQPALPKLASGGGYVLAYAYYNQVGPQGGPVSGNGIIDPANAIFNELSQLTKYNDLGGNGGALGAANVTFAATDGIIGWGRWDGYTDPAAGTLPGPLSPGAFHYVIGLPTAVMPTFGTATYNLMGYTNPTASDGSTGWNVTGNLTVSFGTGNLITVNMNVWNAANNYAINGTANGTGAAFTGVLATSSALCISAGCSTSINGFFAGANASRAGISYQINDTLTPKTIDGVAVFASTIPPPLLF